VSHAMPEGCDPVQHLKPAFWVTAILICVLDLTSKSWVFGPSCLNVPMRNVDTMADFNRLPRTNRPLIGESVRLVAMLNPGMMWGTFHEYSSVLKVLRLVAVFVILYLLRGFGAEQRMAHVALGGILGGAVGNITDSFLFPGVRDFLEVDLDIRFFDPFPAFNVADSAICVGVAALALGLIRTRSRTVDERRVLETQ